MLLGWHRASLARDVVRALVHRVLKVAKCDVLVFVDRKGDGITGVPGATAPVVAAITSEEDAASVSEIAQRLADNLGTTVQRMSGHDVVPDVVAASHEAPVVVVAVEHMMEEESDFGAVPTALAAQTECPVLVVRPSSLHVSIIPGMTPASSRQAVRA
jgi:nucleotide-binding universal stress UspA family protein